MNEEEDDFDEDEAQHYSKSAPSQTDLRLHHRCPWHKPEVDLLVCRFLLPYHPREFVSILRLCLKRVRRIRIRHSSRNNDECGRLTNHDRRLTPSRLLKYRGDPNKSGGGTQSFSITPYSLNGSSNLLTCYGGLNLRWIQLAPLWRFLNFHLEHP